MPLESPPFYAWVVTEMHEQYRRDFPVTEWGMRALFILFLFLGVRYQIKLLDYLVFGDETETIVASKMMAAGMSLYSEIFNHHGPMTFFSGYFIELIGDHGVRAHRIPIVLLQIVSMVCVYFSPIFRDTNTRIIYTILASTVMLILLPDLFGSMYLYQNIAGLFTVIILAQYTLPAIICENRVNKSAAVIGNALIAILPFIAITYAPLAAILFLVSFRFSLFKSTFLGLIIGGAISIAFLCATGSLPGFFAFHIYLNSKVLPLYNGGQSPAQLIFTAFKAVTGSIAGFSTLCLVVASVAASARFEKSFPWRSLLLAAGIGSLLIRGDDFHGLPYYYALLALPIALLANVVLSAQAVQVIMCLALICMAKLSMVLPGERERLRSVRNPVVTEFSQLAEAFTSQDDRVIVYSFNNNEYIASHRLPASGHFFYLPWQEKYNEDPQYGIKIDACQDIKTYGPKLMMIDKWKVWGAFSWESYAGCIQQTLDSDYVQMTGKPYYLRKDIYSSFISDKSLGKRLESADFIAANDMQQPDEKSMYSVSGNDPYMLFELKNPVPTDDKRISFNLSCENSTSKSVPVQIYWATDKEDFSEGRSFIASVQNGRTSIDMEKLPNWQDGQSLKGIRLDLVDKACSKALFNEVEVEDGVKK